MPRPNPQQRRRALARASHGAQHPGGANAPSDTRSFVWAGPAARCSRFAPRAGEKPDPLCACICSPNEPDRSVFNLRAHIKRESSNPKNAPGSHAQVTAAELPAGAAALLSIDAAAEAAPGGAAEEPEEEEEEAAAPADVPDVVM